MVGLIVRFEYSSTLDHCFDLRPHAVMYNLERYSRNCLSTILLLLIIFKTMCNSYYYYFPYQSMGFMIQAALTQGNKQTEKIRPVHFWDKGTVAHLIYMFVTNSNEHRQVFCMYYLNWKCYGLQILSLPAVYFITCEINLNQTYNYFIFYAWKL